MRPMLERTVKGALLTNLLFVFRDIPKPVGSITDKYQLTIDDFAKLTEISFERKFKSPTQYLLPIPSTDINRDPQLVNNPGY